MKRAVFLIINVSFHLLSCAQSACYLLGRNQKSRHSFGNFILSDGKIDKYLYDGGYVSFTSAGPHYYYYIKDHLGSNRAVLDEKGEILQLVHYYPFGGIFADAGISREAQEYLFCGKEREPVHGMNTYDFGSRQYFNDLPLWDRMDPLCEKRPELSPYIFCGNNPIKNYDVNGKDFKVIIDFNFITITAKVYSMDEDYMDAQAAAEWINGQSGKYVWSYKVGEETKDLPINFDITVENVTERHGSKRYSLDFARSKDNVLMTENAFWTQEGEWGERVGLTEVGRNIKVKPSNDMLPAIVHEFGHALGMYHEIFGVMTKGVEDLGHDMNFIENNIYDMMHRAFDKGYESLKAEKGDIINIGTGKLYNNSNIDVNAFKKGYPRKRNK